jgi:EAL domain-containing protein (putative c-di-GMP-specific phosphodiesterase class I)
MSGRQTILIVDDDRGITEALAALLEKPGREIVVCASIESAQIVVERMRVSCVVTDVRLTSPFRFEGLDFIRDVKRHSPESVIVLMTGSLTGELTREAIARGATAVLAKPFSTEELEALIGPPDSDEEARLEVIPSIDEVIGGGRLVPHFQPIVDLTAGEQPHGFESLARFEIDGILHSPQALFAYAERGARIVDLEVACIRSTFARCRPLLAGGSKLFINIHPAVIGSPLLASALDEMLQSSGIDAGQVVLEITEQQSLGEAREVAVHCAALRALGLTFALDDVGVAYSHLTHIDAIAPAYLKVSQDFGGSFERDVTKTKIVRNLLSLARNFGCELVLEGIETSDTRDAARAEGIRLAQGYLFGRPEPLDVRNRDRYAVPASQPSAARHSQR